jgi:hypothetical protein
MNARRWVLAGLATIGVMGARAEAGLIVLSATTEGTAQFDFSGQRLLSFTATPGPYLRAGDGALGPFQSAVGFDLGALPAGAVVTAATLTLHAAGYQAAPGTIVQSVYALGPIGTALTGADFSPLPDPRTILGTARFNGTAAPGTVDQLTTFAAGRLPASARTVGFAWTAASGTVSDYAASATGPAPPTLTVSFDVAAVPEPSSAVLVLGGMAVLGAAEIGRRRRAA